MMPAADDDAHQAAAEQEQDVALKRFPYLTRATVPAHTYPACRRSRESAGIWTGSLGFLRPSGFLRALGITEPVAVAFDRDDLGVVGEPIDQRDGAGGVGKDRVPLLEG